MCVLFHGWPDIIAGRKWISFSDYARLRNAVNERDFVVVEGTGETKVLPSKRCMFNINKAVSGKEGVIKYSERRLSPAIKLLKIP